MPAVPLKEELNEETLYFHDVTEPEVKDDAFQVTGHAKGVQVISTFLPG